MSGSIKIAGHEHIRHDIANDKLVYGTGVPAGTVIGNASLSYAELGSDTAGVSNAFALAHMDTKSHTANCSVTFDNDQWSFDQAGDYILSVSLVFYRSNGSRIAIFTTAGSTLSLAYMGQSTTYDTGEVGAGNLLINGYRFTVAASEITGESGVVKYGVYRFRIFYL